MGLKVSQDQVNQFRMDRHYLTKRAITKEIPAVVERVCGIQAQMTAAANLQLWARVENLKPADVLTPIFRHTLNASLA